jgi:hypothetical protein
MASGARARQGFAWEGRRNCHYGHRRPHHETDSPREFDVTVHTPGLLTPEEFASCIEVAITSPDPNIPSPHLAKLVTLGYVAVTAKGIVVTGDGLIRITESE